MKKIILILLIIAFPFPLHALEKMLKVKVLSRYELDDVQILSTMVKLRVPSAPGSAQEFYVYPDTPLVIKAHKNELEVLLKNNVHYTKSLQLDPPRGTALTIKSGDLERKFTGTLSVRNSKGHLSFVENLPIEDYVERVLEAEIPKGFPLEALKAQAILIRTYAFMNEGRHAREGFDLCDLTHCQVYSGKQIGYSSFEEAAQSTRGLMLAWKLKPTAVYYHSTCGGHTSDIRDVFGGAEVEYLKGVCDQNYCERSPHYQWESFIDLNILKEVLNKELKPKLSSELKDLQISRTDDVGRVEELVLESNRKTTLSSQNFISFVGKYLGWSVIKSNWFTVEKKDTGLVFKGRGLGHGVGLCQWGAKAMAEEGKNFEQILQHYFPGTQLIQRSI